VFAKDTQQGFCILAAIGAKQGHYWLRGEAHGIGDGDADAPVADIETEKAGLGGDLERLHPRILVEGPIVRTVQACRFAAADSRRTA
jgi:hypothetical protein